MRVAVPIRLLVPVVGVVIAAATCVAAVQLWQLDLAPQVITRRVEVHVPVPLAVPVAVPVRVPDLSVRLAPGELGGDTFTPTLGPGPGATFPAVSEDGTTVVDLVASYVDFVGTPVATLVFWNRQGEVARFQLDSDFDESPAQQAREREVVAAANARLAQDHWRPLGRGTGCGDEELLRSGGAMKRQTTPQAIRAAICRSVCCMGVYRDEWGVAARR